MRVYDYGNIDTPTGIPSRRNRFTGEVQFLLWKEGENGHNRDFWHRAGDGHTFVKLKRVVKLRRTKMVRFYGDYYGPRKSDTLSHKNILVMLPSVTISYVRDNHRNTLTLCLGILLWSASIVVSWEKFR